MPGQPEKDDELQGEKRREGGLGGRTPRKTKGQWTEEAERETKEKIGDVELEIRALEPLEEKTVRIRQWRPTE